MDETQSGMLRYDYGAWRLLKEGLQIQQVSKRNTPGWRQFRMYHNFTDNPIDFNWNMDLHNKRYYLGMNEFEMEAAWFILNEASSRKALIIALSAPDEKGYYNAEGRWTNVTREQMGMLRIETLRRALAPLLGVKYTPLK